MNGYISTLLINGLNYYRERKKTKIKTTDKNDLALYKKILALPKESRCIESQSNHGKPPTHKIVLGVKENKPYGWSEFSDITQAPSEIAFYLGATHLDLFDAYLNSSFPFKTRELFIGHSTDNYRSLAPTVNHPLDYATITKILSKGNYPNLKAFNFGTTDLFFNGAGLKGAIGDVTELLSKMPDLECLTLSGSFSLSKPIHLLKLKELDIEIVGMTENSLSEAPSQGSFSNLFKSSFPALEQLSVDFECDGDIKRGTGYSFPEDFLITQSMPNLKYLEITGLFKNGEVKKLEDSPLFKKCKHTDCDMREINF